MNSSRRSFVTGTASLLASTALASYAAIAGVGNGISAFITASFVNGADGKGENVKDRLEISKMQAKKLQKMDGTKRAVFLSDLILRWLKKRFRDVPWPKISKDVGRELAVQTLKQLERSGMGGGGKPIPTKIKIKIKFKFKPPSDWEVALEITF